MYDKGHWSSNWKKIGHVLVIDTGEDGTCWGRYLCLHVEFDVFLPLQRGMKLQLEGVDSFWWIFDMNAC